jgi:hypothetical protein
MGKAARASCAPPLRSNYRSDRNPARTSAITRQDLPLAHAIDNQDLLRSEVAWEAGAAAVGELVSGSARNLLTICGTSGESRKL